MNSLDDFSISISLKLTICWEGKSMLFLKKYYSSTQRDHVTLRRRILVEAHLSTFSTIVIVIVI